MEWSRIFDEVFESQKRTRKTDSKLTLSPGVQTTAQTAKESPSQAHNRLHDPFKKLPVEVIIEVFLWCIAVFYKEETRLVIFRRSDRWIVVSQVCRHWRDVALAAPALWTHIEPSYHEWTREVLRRSGTAPLRVRAAWRGDRWTNEVMSEVLAQLGRIQDFELSARRAHLRTIVACLPDWNAPSMTSIDFQCVDDILAGPDDIPHSILGIYAGAADQGLFAELVIPHIQRVRLSRWDYDTISPLLIWPSIRELTLESINMRSTSALFSALQDLPHLEALSLRYSFDGPQLPVKYDAARNSIPLPHLRRLALIGPMTPSLTLLSSMQLSPSTCITLDDAGLLTPSFDPQYLASVLATTTYGVGSRISCTSTAPAPLLSISIDVARFEAHIAPQVKLSAYRAQFPASGAEPGPPVVCVMCVAFSGHLFEHLAYVGDALDLSGVQYLDLGPLVHYLPHEFCRKMPGLRKVYYRGTSPRMFNSLATFSDHVVFKWKRS